MRKSNRHLTFVSKKHRPAKAMGGCDEYPEPFDEKKCNKGKIDQPNSTMS